MSPDELIARYPRLWHMAHSESWPAIQKDGLMSANALMRAYELSQEQKAQHGSVRRPESVPLTHPERLGAVLRDQKPMSDGALEKCLVDMTPGQWYQHLNSFTFFWLSRSRIWALLGARAYRNVAQTVLTIDTRSLVQAHQDRIWLSPMNSGSTIYAPLARGRDTFKRIHDFPFEERAKRRPTAANVVELLVEDSVPDIAEHVLAVHECRNSEILRVLWERPGASPDDHP